ncbi:hypothetical protein HC823_01030 [Candidatus Gracilibacteria bacterium]|nr:hypothetical protein [Candidatus Gracilibacteria bacterium]
MNLKFISVAIGGVFLIGGSAALYQTDTSWLQVSVFSDVWESLVGGDYQKKSIDFGDYASKEGTKESLESFQDHHQKLRTRYINKGYFYDEENTIYDDEMGFMPRSIKHSEEHKEKLKQALDTSKEIEELLKKTSKEVCMVCMKQAPGNPGQAQCMKACR